TREKLHRLSQRFGLPISLHHFINEMKHIYTMRIIYQRCWPVFQHQYALAELRRDGYSLGVASNSFRSSIEAMLSRAKLIQYLDIILSNEDVVNGKPNPEIYLKSFERLGLKASECIVVEDNPHGIAAAKAAGAHVLSVRDPSEVTYEAIKSFITQCNMEPAKCLE
ncbi:HAD family phosphatase, partial [Enterobacter cloacae complex sp. P6RS]|uniref:HAD family hydrolase n=1 Tax=Enterobacter cloacae complex sp. P6RS TaxID=2779588 RepID=UPI001D0BECB6